MVKGQLRLLNCKKDKLGHKHLIHINKFVRKDSNALNNLKLEMVEWELNGVFCECGVSVFLRAFESFAQICLCVLGVYDPTCPFYNLTTLIVLLPISKILFVFFPILK